MTIAVNLPHHVYGFVDKRFLSGGEQAGWEPAVWFAVTLPPNRAIGLTVLLECGGIYRELPPHAWAFKVDAPDWTLEQAQRWNCFGGDSQAIAYDYLAELDVFVLPIKETGRYLFSIETWGTGFSREPAQSKTFNVIQLDNGRITLRPGNDLLFNEASFTVADGPPKWLRRQTEIWSVDEGPAWWYPT